MGPCPHNSRFFSQGAIKTTSWSRSRSIRRTLMMVVGCGGVLGWTAHVVWEQNRPAKLTIRAMGSWDPGERVDAIRDLEMSGLGDSRIAIPPLIAALRDTDAKVRVSAAIALGPIGTDAVTSDREVDSVRAVIAALLSAMNDADPDVRTAAANSLGYVAGSKGAGGLIDLKAVITTVVARLAERDAEARLAVLYVLTAVGREAGGDPPQELAAALADESAQNRATAATAVANFPSGLDPWVPHLFQIMEHDEELQVRAACARAMKRVRPPAISRTVLPVLVAALRRPDRRVKATACSVLIHFGPEARAAIPALIAIAEDKRDGLASPDPEYWDSESLVFQALGRIAPGTESAAETIATLTEIVRAEDPDKRQPAVEALGEFGPAAVSAIPELIQILRTTADTDRESLAQSAALALGRIALSTPSSAAAVVALTGALQAKSAITRSAAIFALSPFGPEAATAISRLLALRKDPDPSVRRDVEYALARLIKAADGPGY